MPFVISFYELVITFYLMLFLRRLAMDKLLFTDVPHVVNWIVLNGFWTKRTLTSTCLMRSGKNAGYFDCSSVNLRF